jgi:hypothetical protein
MGAIESLRMSLEINLLNGLPINGLLIRFMIIPILANVDFVNHSKYCYQNP